MKAGSGKSCPTCGDRYDADVLFCPKDGTPLASTRNPSLTSIPTSDRDPYIGIELPGQIRIDTLIGIGSMGRVYRAFQAGIDRDVAVKVLHRELSGNVELTGRFHREAKVASRLIHPNVVQVLMTGAMPTGDSARAGGELYLVMEFLDGISLLSALAAAGGSGASAALPLPRALHIGLQICDAVGEAHAQGIVHRDLKPENVMLVRRGDSADYVKVLDFGIARLDWADRGAATQAGLIFGTAKYISPEGAEGHPVSPAADVYSIATMLYQMLAGRTPFDGDSPVALLVQHTHAPPLDLRSIARASYVPAPLAATIMANLAKKPNERAPNARQLARDLVAAARASGLYPEEFASQATLFSPASSQGAVKLASRERTRAHELSADLAAKIGGVAASSMRDPKSVPQTPLAPHTAPTRIDERRVSVPTGAGFTVVSSSTDEHEPVDASELLLDSPGSVRAPRNAPSSIASLSVSVSSRASGGSGASGPPPMPSFSSFSSSPPTAPSAGAARAPQTPAPPYGAPRENGDLRSAAGLDGEPRSHPTRPVPPPPSSSSGISSNAGQSASAPHVSDPGKPTVIEDPTLGTMPGTPLGHVAGEPSAHGPASDPASISSGGVNATIHGEDPRAIGLATGAEAATSLAVGGEAAITPEVVSTHEVPVVSARTFAQTLRAARRSGLRARIGLLVACLFVGLPVLAIGGRRAGLFGAAAASDSLEAALEDARECMRHRAWDAPKARNFKLVTDEALQRWPDSVALLELRREGAVLIVNDALARKYASDPVEAAHLVELALHFDPDLTTAQHLAQELATDKQKEAAPVASTSASADRRIARPKGPGTPVSSPPALNPRTPQTPPQTTPASGTRQGGGTPPASTGPWL